MDLSRGIDLSKVKEASVTDLSQEAIRARGVRTRVAKAASWARKMRSTFKGISRHGRQFYIDRALEMYNLTLEEIHEAQRYFQRLADEQESKRGA